MTPSERAYVVAGAKPWNRRIFDERLSSLPGRWTFVDTPAELEQALAASQARYAFFLHWSWRVPEHVLAQCECVVFHMTDVPYGRGGTPLQNLIIRGHTTTVLSAIRMTDVIDGGPVYDKRPLDLSGTAESVYLRATELAAEMIESIAEHEPVPVPQDGEVVPFERRRPTESELPTQVDLDGLHDFIRMLDADGYPAAFLDHGPWRVEFRRSARYADRVEADVRIYRREA